MNVADHRTFLESPSKTYVEWTIWDAFRISNLFPIGYIMYSPSFSLSDTTWSLKMCGNIGLIDGTVGTIIGLIPMENNRKKDYEIQYTIGVKDNNGAVFMSIGSKYKYNKQDDGYGSEFFFRNSAVLSSSNIIAPDGSLNFFCNAQVVDSMDVATQTINNDTVNLSSSLRDLYKDRRFTDATIVVRGREFFVHRNILSVRSAVFSAMFETNMTEKNTGRVDITDCDPDSFEDFLLFLYTGQFDMVSSSNAISLYKTADKYDIKELKEECVLCMSSELSVDLVCDVLHLAALHNESELLQTASEFFFNNAEAIVKTIKWQTFLVQNISLGNELNLKLKAIEDTKRDIDIAKIRQDLKNVPL